MRNNYKDLLNKTLDEVEAIAGNPSHPLCQQVQEQQRAFFQEWWETQIPRFSLPKDFPAIAEHAKEFAGGFIPPINFAERIAPYMPQLEKIRADMEEADREADKLIHFVKNTRVPIQDFPTLPPVNMMTVLSIIAKNDVEAAKKVEAIWGKRLKKAREKWVKDRKIKAKGKSENIKKAIEDYIAYRIKNGINDFPRLKDISEHLKGQFVKQNKDDKDRYTEKSLMRAIEEIVPKIKAERSKNMSL